MCPFHPLLRLFCAAVLAFPIHGLRELTVAKFHLKTGPVNAVSDSLKLGVMKIVRKISSVS